MASPVALGSTTSSLVEPSRNGKYRLQLGKVLLERKEPDRRFWSVRYNHKPRQPQDATRKAIINRSASRPSSPTLTITDHDETFGGDIEHSYKGRGAGSEDSYALIYNKESKVFTLEALRGRYGFNLQGQSVGNAAGNTASGNEDEMEDPVDRYGDATADLDYHAAPTSPAVQPVGQGQGQLVKTEGNSSQVNGIAGSATPALSIVESEGNKSNSPNPSNPFDFRHYLSAIPGANHDDSIKVGLSLHSLPGTPQQRPSAAATASRSGHIPSRMGTPAPVGASDPLAPRSGASANGSQATIMSSTPLTGATKPRKRKAPTDALRPMGRDKHRRLVDSQSSVSNTAPSTKIAPTASTVSLQQEKAPASNSNDLIIEGEDSPPHSQFPPPSFNHHNSQSSPMRPQSLRKIATSRNASPAHGFASSYHRNSSQSQSRSNLSGLGLGVDLTGGRPRSSTLLTNESTTSLASAGVGNGNGTGTDADVESDCALGSPEWDPRKQETGPPRVLVGNTQAEEEEMEDEDEDDDEDVFDRAIQEAIEASDVGDVDGSEDEAGLEIEAAAPVTQIEDESEESEEE